MAGNGNLLIHLHVPKTGGTTMRSIVLQQYDQSKIKEIYPTWGMTDSINQIHDLTHHEKNEINCLQGHFVYGVHVYFEKPAQYIAMLRDPVEQVVSTYYYIKGLPHHPYYKELVANNITLNNFHLWDSHHFTELNNSQTRYMAGVASRKLKVEDLETAKRNVQEKFALVGLTERFDESVFLLNKILDWEVLTYTSQNITSVRPKQVELPLDIINQIREYNKLDVELYQFTSDLFNKKIEALNVDARLELEKFIENRKNFEHIQSFGENRICNQFINWIYNNNNSQVYIFGAGEAGKLTHNIIKAMNDRFKSNIYIKAFIDNDQRKWGEQLLETPIISLSSVDYSQNNQMIIASMYVDEIEKQLLSLQIPRDNMIISLIR